MVKRGESSTHMPQKLQANGFGLRPRFGQAKRYETFCPSWQLTRRLGADRCFWTLFAHRVWLEPFGAIGSTRAARRGKNLTTRCTIISLNPAERRDSLLMCRFLWCSARATTDLLRAITWKVLIVTGDLVPVSSLPTSKRAGIIPSQDCWMAIVWQL